MAKTFLSVLVRRSFGASYEFSSITIPLGALTSPPISLSSIWWNLDVLSAKDPSLLLRKFMLLRNWLMVDLISWSTLPRWFTP